MSSRRLPPQLLFFFFNDTATTEIYTLSLHDALPISVHGSIQRFPEPRHIPVTTHERRSEEHTSELQSPYDIVCRLLLEKKKKAYRIHHYEIKNPNTRKNQQNK